MPQSKPTAPGEATAARLATTSVSIDLRDLVLLGTFGSPTEPRALLRLPDGSVQRVAPGDTVGARKVAAIDEGQVVFSGAGRPKSLGLPGQRRPAPRSRQNGSR